MGKRTCIETDCDRPSAVRGLCRHHQILKWAGVTAEGEPLCAEDLCTKPIEIRGLCKTHYRAACKAGTIRIAKRNAHEVDNVNLAELTADCSECGLDIPIFVKDGAATCAVRQKRAARTAMLRSRYGIDLATYEQLLLEQDGACGICGGNPDAGRSLAVDHDHKTGRVRGLLCTRCNAALGYLRDDPEAARRAAAYLEKCRSA